MREAKRREVYGYCVLFRREVESFYLFIYFFLRRWEAETETERLKCGYWVLFMREAERLKD